MGKNSQTASGADAGGNLLYFSPEKLTLVTDKNSPLYDERVNLPLDESLVRNIATYGIIEPVVLRLNGKKADDTPIVEVVVGRQRVRACLEANKRLVAEGKEPHRVPAIMKRAEAGTLMGVMISENEIRRADSTLVRARKLERFLATGKTEEEAATAFGVTKQTVKNLLTVLELHPAVQKAIEKDEVPTNVARELAAVPQEEQPAALEKLVAAGTVRGHRGVEAAKKVRDGGVAESNKVRMLSRKRIEQAQKKAKKAENKEAHIAAAVLSHVLGSRRALADFPHLREVFEEA